MPGVLPSSAVTMSEKARPIQSLDASAPRFSKRTIAMRSTAGRGASRRHAIKRARAAMARGRRARLQDTRLQRQQLLKFLRVPQRCELGVGLQLLLLFETFFQRFPQVLQGQIVAAALGVG